MKKKKPTIKQIEKVVNNLIINLENLMKRMYNIEFILDNYHEWKGEKDEFKKYVLDKAKELSKDGDSKSVSSK
jgi:hypothetical protein